MSVVTQTARKRGQNRWKGELHRAVTRLSDPLNRLRWLVDFAERAGRVEPGELSQLLADLRFFCALGGQPSIDRSAHPQAPRAVSFRRELRRRRERAARQLADLSREAAKALEVLDRGDSWNVELPASCRLWLTLPRRGKPQKAFTGDLRASFFLALADLLAVESGRISRCRECERFFVRRKRGAYCSRRCSQRMRDRRFRANKSPEWFREYRHRVYVRQWAKARGVSEKTAVRMVGRRSAGVRAGKGA